MKNYSKYLKKKSNVIFLFHGVIDRNPFKIRNYTKKHLLKKGRILSIGSGRCISELPLINDGYNIICSDMEIPKCYEASKKIFCEVI